MSEATKPKEIPRDKKVNFLISKFMHYTYSSQFKSQIVARSFIDSLVTHTHILPQTVRNKRSKASNRRRNGLPVVQGTYQTGKNKRHTEIDAVHPSRVCTVLQ
ncbi:hypothetical protein WA026_006505 [Henosepilachna vigintioctopunctata]|uniref:Uncharacterized protein n=1 Tax=Henosepilachna vigintioctopunctata TaxID=420089 RepID=A0AAW1UEH2_9CUCU